MPSSPLSAVVQQLRVAAGRAGVERTDGELLTQFLNRRYEDALAALVERHAPMVWSVCRRLLRNPHDAEDAFQATFLVLVQKAATVVPPELVANWLYGVAQQTAVRLRAMAAKRGWREVQMKEMPEPAVADARDEELLALLDQELSRLPERSRALIVLCDLEGRTRKEVSRQLGCPEGTVASGLARARELLAKRLTRRGVAVSGGSLAITLSQSVVSADVPPVVVTSAINVATLFARGKATGMISGSVTTLTQGVLKTMFLKKLMTTVAAVLALGVAVITGGSALAHRTPAVGPQESRKEPLSKSVVHAPVPKAKPKVDKEMLQGTWYIVKAEAGGKHQAIETSKEQTWVFTADKLVINYDDKSRLEMSYQIDPKQQPKAIDLSPVDEREKGYVFKGIYELDGDSLNIYYSRNVAPDAERPERFDPEREDRGMRWFVLKRAPAKQPFTAWGQEVGGLQAGVALEPGDERQYKPGDRAAFEVKVRNVGKAAVTITYCVPHEHAPEITDSKGRQVRVTMPPIRLYYAVPTERVVKPGETMTLFKNEVTVGAEVLEPQKGPEAPVSTPTIRVGPGTYKIAIGGVVRSHPKLSTGSVEFVVKKDEPAAESKDEVVWGKEVGGLQAGVGLPPGAKRVYHHGETVALVVRVRNVGKETVKFQYVKQFLDEKRPAVTDAAGKNLSQTGTTMLGIHGPTEVTLEGGKEIVLETRMHGTSGSLYELLPVNGERKAATKEWPLLVGTGKVGFQYNSVLGNSSSGTIKLDPALSKLATGRLELEVKEAPAEQQKPLTPEEATRMKGGSKRTVEFKVESVTKAVWVKAIEAPKDAVWEKGHGPDDVSLRPQAPPERAQTRFSAILTADTIKQLNKAGIRDIEKHFQGKTIRVTGTIAKTDYRGYGTPSEVEIVVSDLSQLEVVK